MDSDFRAVLVMTPRKEQLVSRGMSGSRSLARLKERFYGGMHEIVQSPLFVCDWCAYVLSSE
jgi:hypothetical protein